MSTMTYDERIHTGTIDPRISRETYDKVVAECKRYPYPEDYKREVTDKLVYDAKDDWCRRCGARVTNKWHTYPGCRTGTMCDMCFKM